MKTCVLIVLSFFGVFCMVSCSKSDSKIAKNIRHAEALVLTDPDSAHVVLNGIEPNQLNNPVNMARYKLVRTITNDRFGIAHESTDDILAARDYFITSRTSDSLLAVAHLYTGRVQESLGQAEDALKSYLTAESTLKKTPGNHYWKGRVDDRVAELYHANSDYAQSAIYAEQAIRHFANSHDTLAMANAYNLLGFNHKLEGDNDKALEALGMANNLYSEVGFVDGIMSNALIMSGILLNEPDGAHRADSLMRRTYADHNNGEVPLEHYPMMSRIEAGKDDYRKATEYLQNYMSLSPDMTFKRRASLKYLIATYLNETEQYSSAYNHANEYIAMRDSIYQENIASVLQEVEKKYAKQELENEYRAYRKLMTYRVVIVVILLVVAVGALGFVIRHRRRRIAYLQADLDKLRYEIGEFDNLKKNLAEVLDKHSAKEARLQEVLLKKAKHLQDLVEYLHRYENDSDTFKKIVQTAITEAERDTHFGDSHEIVNEKYAGIVDFLKREYPTLEKDELDFCCLACLGFSNNQLGILFGRTSLASVYNLRHQIKAKIVPASSNTSLEVYLQQTIDRLREG